MTRAERSWVICSIEALVVYSNEDKQSRYSTGYCNGRLLVNRNDVNEPLPIRYLKDLCEECIRGYCDGIRDEILFQQQQEIEALQNEEGAS